MYVAEGRKAKTEDTTINMNTQMGSSLPSKKLDRSNYSSWEYKMTQYLVGKGIGATSTAHKKTNPKSQTPTTQRGSKE